MMTLLFVFFLSPVVVILSALYYKLWWKPIQIQHVLRSQGLKGPCYKFISGNTKEIKRMIKEAISIPSALSQHHLFPIILPHYNTWKTLYGNNFLIWIGHQPQIIVTEAELVKEILANKDGLYVKVKQTGHAKKLLGDGLFSAEGEKWSRLRKLANGAFHGQSLKDMFPDMLASVECMLEKWGSHSSREIEISKEFKLLTSEVISRAAFGSSYMEGKNIFDMMNKLGVLVAKSIYAFTIPGVGKIWRSKDEVESDRIERMLRESIMVLVNKREDEARTGQTKSFGCDFLGSLLKAHHDCDPKSKISVDDVISECKIFYIAGHETTSSLLGWVAVLLSIYTEWQEKARDEVFQLFGSEKPTTEGIARLKIITMIVNEALRLYSPVVHIVRKTHTKTRLGQYELPSNMEVVISPLSLHNNPEIWGQDAHQFNPGRFVDGLARATNGNPFVFLPFGAGPRVCVGLNFAVNEAKIALSMILQRYKLKVSPNYVHSPFQLLTISPQYDIPIILQSLTSIGK